MVSSKSGTNEEVMTASTGRKLDNVNSIISKKSGGVIHCLESKDEGLSVSVTRDMQVQSSEPTNIMTCQAAAIALDPPFRQTHCSFCATTGTTLYALEGCQMVSACAFCGPSLMKDGYHRSKEFEVLKKMEATFGPSIDSIFVLTARLLCCQQKDWWKLFRCLYEHQSAAESMQENIELICSHLPEPANDPSLFRETLGRVLGCSHNITDFSRPLGNQSLGRAIFMEHSFYNHSCAPNAYLSCQIRSNETGPSTEGIGPLTAQVHLLNDAKKGEEITLSYIPMSGLSNQERKKTLEEGYGFECKCSACSALEPAISLSESMDVQSVREIQFSCNERLLAQKKKKQNTPPRILEKGKSDTDHDDDDETEQVISLVQMTQRGIRNQGIPETHEVSMESHRLLALAYSMMEDWSQTKKHHERFLELTGKIPHLFDPVALGTQLLEYAGILKRTGSLETTLANQKHQEGLGLLQRALGKGNPWVVSLLLEDSQSRDMKHKAEDGPQESEKRQKVEKDS